MAAILVVDDEPEIRSFLRLFLESEGHEVRTASNGQAAAELALAQPPDLVLTDWAMPRLGGDGLCTLLRDAEQTRQVPVIIMSAVTSSIPTGCSAFLEKPFELDQLLGLIGDHLDGKERPGSSHRRRAAAKPRRASRRPTVH